MVATSVFRRASYCCLISSWQPLLNFEWWNCTTTPILMWYDRNGWRVISTTNVVGLTIECHHEFMFDSKFMFYLARVETCILSRSSSNAIVPTITVG